MQRLSHTPTEVLSAASTKHEEPEPSAAFLDQTHKRLANSSSISLDEAVQMAAELGLFRREAIAALNSDELIALTHDEVTLAGGNEVPLTTISISVDNSSETEGSEHEEG